MSQTLPGGKPLILGIGNLLMGDEGIGVLAARHLEQAGLGGRAIVMDGGTGGFHLLGCFTEHKRVILIDAALDGRQPGTVSLLHPRFARDFPKCLGAHDIGLRDLVETAAALSALPRIDLITISIEAPGAMGLAVSPAVEASLPAVEELVGRCLDAP